MLDAHLATRPWMAGERFTMADIPIGCEIHRWWGLPQPRPALPNLASWYTAVQARPATRGVLDLPLSLNPTTRGSPMPIRPFKQIDVFTATPYFGNPLAVVLDGAGLDDEAMQRFAHWTNLSETTFVLPPTEAGRAGGADYRVRIFTPGGELPFAGHPTLGTCHAWLEAGGTPRASGAAGGTPRHEEVIVQECGVGLVRIRRRGHRLAFAAPPVQRSTPGPALLARVAGALGLKAPQILAAQVLDNGPVWLGLLLDNPETVLALDPDHAQLKELGQKVGVASVNRSSFDDAIQLIARSSREAGLFARRTRCRRRAGTRPGGARLCRAHRRERRPGHRQPERQPRAVADRRRPLANGVPGRPGCLPRARRARAHRARRAGPGLGWRRIGHLHRRQGGTVNTPTAPGTVQAGSNVPVDPPAGALDHLVIMAARLAEGVAWCEATLGVTPGPGGEHPLMGTHNRLLRIATPDFPNAYLEIIAINPVADNDQRTLGKRWFDMENPDLTAQVARDGPQLVHWVARVPDVRAAVASLAAQGFDRGEVIQASRATPSGLLQWQITVRPDGQRLMDGCLPTLIQWGDTHPAASMPDSGVTLQSLELRHPDATALRTACDHLGLVQPAVKPGPARLSARLLTPKGLIELHSGNPLL
jgi:PhzF family phenazine biosynthesis protein